MADIKLARQEFLAQLARNNSERQELLQILQASQPTGTDYPMTVTRSPAPPVLLPHLLLHLAPVTDPDYPMTVTRSPALSCVTASCSHN